MSEPQLEIENDVVLHFHCPHCGKEEHDEYEVLDTDQPAEMRCESCQQLFSALLLECDRCGTEAISTAPTAAAHPAAATLVCPGCGKKGLDHDEVADTDTEDID